MAADKKDPGEKRQGALTDEPMEGSADEGAEAVAPIHYSLPPDQELTEAEKRAIEEVGPSPAHDSVTSGINDF